MQASAQVGGLGPAQGEDRVGRACPDAGEAVEGRPPHQVEEDRLGLVVGGVAEAGALGQGGTARSARPLLEVRAALDHGSHGHEGGAEAGGQAGHDVGLRRRAWSEAVVDVHGRGRAAGRHGEHEQGGGVGTARHRAGDGFTGRRERAAADEGGDERVVGEGSGRQVGHAAPPGPQRSASPSGPGTSLRARSTHCSG
ncbi:MAG: hypothetical protein GEV08_08425 [Acidimicrobiia bacterium]|nr:hypothetical protein [Acidimicrobiia bacterium]